MAKKTRQLAALYPVGQCVTQSSSRRRYPGEHVRQCWRDAPVQEEQARSQGKQYPSSVPSATCRAPYVPAGHSLTQVMSEEKPIHNHLLYLEFLHSDEVIRQCVILLTIGGKTE